MLNEKYQKLKRNIFLGHTWGTIICITNNKWGKTHLNGIVKRICIFMCVHLGGQIHTLIYISHRYKHPFFKKKKAKQCCFLFCLSPLQGLRSKNYGLIGKCRCGSLPGLYEKCCIKTTTTTTKDVIIFFYNIKTQCKGMTPAGCIP